MPPAEGVSDEPLPSSTRQSLRKDPSRMNGSLSDVEVPDRGAVLIVEDEPNIRELEEEILVNGKFRVEGVGTAEEALLLAAHRSYEVILLDLHLPGEID